MAFRNPAIIQNSTRSPGILQSEPPLAPESGRQHQQVCWHSIQDRNGDYDKKFRASGHSAEVKYSQFSTESSKVAARYGTPYDLPPATGGKSANLQGPNAPFAMDGAAAPPSKYT